MVFNSKLQARTHNFCRARNIWCTCSAHLQVFFFCTFLSIVTCEDRFPRGLRQIRMRRLQLLQELEKQRNDERAGGITGRKIEALDLEYPHTHKVTFNYLTLCKFQMRYDVVISQVVSAAATSIAAKAQCLVLYSSPADIVSWFHQIYSIGFLLQVAIVKIEIRTNALFRRRVYSAHMVLKRVCWATWMGL